jgi:membrane associated rhomboid family serine protease
MAKSFLDDIKYTLRTGNVLTRLILVNSAVFLIANISVYIIRYAGFIDYLALPSTFHWLIRYPWTIITYMFLHLELGHVFWNMIWLYSMGRIFTDFMGPKRLLSVYLMGGIAGGLTYLLVNEMVFLGGPLLGASAGVMAIVVAAGAYAPDYIVNMFLVGPVRLKYVALFSFIATSIIDFTINTGGKISHIGGALFGLLYGLQYKRGIDLSKGITYLIDRITSIFKPREKSRLKVTHSKKRKITDEEYNIHRVAEQQVVDAILDKISRSGYDSLTKKEKEILFRASNKDKRDGPGR